MRCLGRLTMVCDRGRFHVAMLRFDKGRRLLHLLGLPERDFETFLLLKQAGCS